MQVSIPPAIDLEEVIKLGLVISTPTGAIDLLERSRRGEGHLIGADTDDGTILLMEVVNVHGPVGVEFMPFQDQRSEVGDGRAGDLEEG